MMTSEEINYAMKNKVPVEYRGKTYDYIQEYIMWYDRKNQKITSFGLVETRKEHDEQGHEVKKVTIVRVPSDGVTIAK